MTWVRSPVLILTGTGIELVPNAASEFWYVHDQRTGESLSCALPLKQAKREAERLAKERKSDECSRCGYPSKRCQCGDF